ncbi:protein FAM3D [Xenopus tropicalis]|uniref:FAM3 metabolism regulating signaling molecule D n=1 Tax=Xenopus tropicalis TaxID=8364 RepID=F6TS12_XENTR|nr:protein FAM3D [Xenopus tropicalis]|eukprot:XP_004914215.1 PREDICTED: protein FAM3D-like [Xenopus tropicalis]
MRCAAAIIRILMVLLTLFITWYFAKQFYPSKVDMKSLRALFDNEVEEAPEKKKVKYSCGNEKPCPGGQFAFKIISGAGNVVGPSICFDDSIIMSSIKNNIGKGLNIALINGFNGDLIKIASFDMYSGDVEPLVDFLKSVTDGTLVFVASYDDPSSKLNDEARAIFASFGSSYAEKLYFRDAWVFVGVKGTSAKSKFEQHIKNNKETNKYDGWPEVLEMEGCISRETN